MEGVPLFGSITAKNLPGVYALWFDKYECFFHVGSSKRVRTRLHQHKHFLGNPIMRAVAEQRGIRTLKCTVLEYCQVERLEERERYWSSLLPTFSKKTPNREAVERQAQKMRELGVLSRQVMERDPEYIKRKRQLNRQRSKEYYNRTAPLPTKYKTKRSLQAKKNRRYGEVCSGGKKKVGNQPTPGGAVPKGSTT